MTPTYQKEDFEMLESVKSRIEALPRPKNPFAKNSLGEQVHFNLLLTPDNRREAQLKSYSEEAQAAYQEYMAARVNRLIAAKAAGVALAVGTVGSLVWFLTAEDDEDNEFEDDEDLDYDEDDEDDESDE